MRKLLDNFSAEDRWIVASMALTLGGTITGGARAEPRAFGVTALAVVGLLLIGWKVTRSPRLGWLLLFGLVAGVLEHAWGRAVLAGLFTAASLMFSSVFWYAMLGRT